MTRLIPPAPLLLALLTLLALRAVPAWAPVTVDLAIVREVICKHETRGEADPRQAIGPGQELGRCQIKPSTAWQYRGEDTSLIVVLTRMVETPEPIADDILAACAPRARPHLGAYGLAVLYNQGCRFRGAVRGRLHEYAKQVASDYAEALRKARGKP